MDDDWGYPPKYGTSTWVGGLEMCSTPGMCRPASCWAKGQIEIQSCLLDKNSSLCNGLLGRDGQNISPMSLIRWTFHTCESCGLGRKLLAFFTWYVQNKELTGLFSRVPGIELISGQANGVRWASVWIVPLGVIFYWLKHVEPQLPSVSNHLCWTWNKTSWLCKCLHRGGIHTKDPTIQAIFPWTLLTQKFMESLGWLQSSRFCCLPLWGVPLDGKNPTSRRSSEGCPELEDSRTDRHSSSKGWAFHWRW